MDRRSFEVARILKIIFVVVLIIEVFLSHQPGEKSGAESMVLSRSLHMNEKILRISAHVILFATLSFLALLSFPTANIWLRIGAVGAWAFLDEWSKGWEIFRGRHFSWQDVGWNALGCVIGVIAAIAAKAE